jgi:hypothetical protein
LREGSIPAARGAARRPFHAGDAGERRALDLRRQCANEVVTYFFDTEQPSLRIERGDTIDAAVLVPAGSGSEYAASFGREFWMKGEVATYRGADPDVTSIECVVAG